MPRLLPILAAALLALAGAPPKSLDHERFDRILAASVRDELVDYRLIRENWREELKRYLAEMAEVDPDGLDRHDRLAFYINLYNATMIRAVVDERPGFNPADDDFAIFKRPLVALDGERLSLDALEHEIVRKKFDEPRIHVALVCAALSCPPILPRAYRGEDLDAVLEANMRRFVNDPTRNRIDHEARTLELSSLFDWFAEDFGGKQAVPAYVGAYTDGKTKGYSVSFLPYSWELNAR